MYLIVFVYDVHVSTQSLMRFFYLLTRNYNTSLGNHQPTEPCSHDRDTLQA